jgi:hypothetical protein
MGFTVYPPEVRRCAVLIGQDCDAARVASAYVAAHADMSWHDSGIINEIRGVHENLVVQLDDRLHTIGDLLDTAHHRLDAAALWYERADTAAAVAMDATFPAGSDRTEVNTDRYGPAVAAPIAQPDAAQWLSPPSEPEDSIGNGFANPLDFLNLVSPSAWINEAIKSLTGTDVFYWFTDCLTGDWAAIWRFGDVMDNLATFMGQLGANITNAASGVDPWWDGNAADSAEVFLRQLGAFVSAHEPALRTIAKSYHDAAKGAWLLGSQLGNILQTLCDRAIAAGVSAAAGTVLAETGVGAIVGYALAALMIADMLALISRAAFKIQTFGGVILALFGSGMDFFGQGGDLSTLKPPTVTYALPGA